VCSQVVLVARNKVSWNMILCLVAGLLPASLIAPDVSVIRIQFTWQLGISRAYTMLTRLRICRALPYKRHQTQLWGLRCVSTHTSTSTVFSQTTYPNLCWVCSVHFIFHSLMCLTASQLPTMCPLAAGATRFGALGVTGIAILGLTKLNLAGPGLTPTVKKLWTAPPAQ